MEASMSRIKNTMDLLEEMVGLRAGSKPGAAILFIDPARGGGYHTGGYCQPGTNVVGDGLHTEDGDGFEDGFDTFFKEDGTHQLTLHEFGHEFCASGFPGMGGQWTANTVFQYIHLVKGRYDKYPDAYPILGPMVAKDLDFYLLERMVGFSMYSRGKPCGEATFDKKQFDPVIYLGNWQTCWKWLNWLPSKEFGWHIWKDIGTINMKSTKYYKSSIDRMVDIYCQATQHNMLPMFEFWNIKPSDEAIANYCKNLPETDLITKWVNIAKCVKQSMTDEQDIRECGKMPRFPKHKGLCVISGVCNEDETNHGEQSIMNKKFDLYGGLSRHRSWFRPFLDAQYKVSENKEACFSKAKVFFGDCKNKMTQPITATFYGKLQGNKLSYDESNNTFPPPGFQWSQQLNIWPDSACPNVGNVGLTLDECKRKCLVKPSCTAFNFKTDNGRCLLRGCKQPVPAPEWNLPPYRGYYMIMGCDGADQGVPCCPEYTTGDLTGGSEIQITGSFSPATEIGCQDACKAQHPTSIGVTQNQAGTNCYCEFGPISNNANAKTWKTCVFS